MKNNPIIRSSGICDPHIHIFDDKAYLYASHDKSPQNKDWIMEDWCIYSSDNLVDWKLESVIKPESTYVGSSSKCWAVDCAMKNDKYYFYFSIGNEEIGVMVSEHPGKGFVDALGKPLIAKGDTDTLAYDPTVFMEDGIGYLLFGCASVGSYKIVRLKDDMISLAEKPKAIELVGSPMYDDKCYLHKYKELYYLSYGSFYAVSKELYGPYTYVDTVRVSYDHGSFFEYRGQWYNAFTINDPSPYHRASGLTYIHYGEDGKMYADGLINEYGISYGDADWNRIEASWYSKCVHALKTQNGFKGFDISVSHESILYYPSISNIEKYSVIHFFGVATEPFQIEVRDGNEKGAIITVVDFEPAIDDWYFRYSAFSGKLSKSIKDICLTFKGKGKISFFRFD